MGGVISVRILFLIFPTADTSSETVNKASKSSCVSLTLLAWVFVDPSFEGRVLSSTTMVELASL